MGDSVVRLSEIKINDFKNVKNGQLSFDNKRKNYRASILGLYGQNGSGKTALIDALEILKYALSGRTVPEEMADYINVDAEFSSLEYVFDISSELGIYKAYYSFSIKKEEKINDSNMMTVSEKRIENKASYKVVIINECLSYSFDSDNEKYRKSVLIDTNTKKVFLPKAKYDFLIGNSSDDEMDLLIAKRMAKEMSRSFVFSKELIDALKSKENEEDEFKRHLFLIERLAFYGNCELFIINTSNTGIISMNALPLAFKYDKNRASGQILLPLDRPEVVPKDAVQIVKNIINDMNIVLENLVPGLTIGIKELGMQTFKNGDEGITVELISYKNNKAIPLKYESEGIKKIISVLQLFIVIYNDESITVAIDELDSGIFEYLLGEILRIISEKGKGQLIFTSHNLRPLETLDKGFIAFTTTNPDNRYIRMSNIKENNNLRDFYFRDIVLGGQNEELYDATNNAEIAFAFREAGDILGS